MLCELLLETHAHYLPVCDLRIVNNQSATPWLATPKPDGVSVFGPFDRPKGPKITRRIATSESRAQRWRAFLCASICVLVSVCECRQNQTSDPMLFTSYLCQVLVNKERSIYSMYRHPTHHNPSRRRSTTMYSVNRLSHTSQVLADVEHHHVLY